MKNQTLFKSRFVFLWLAQIFSQLAFNMLNFVLIISVFEHTLSNTAVSGLIISFSIPALIFGLLAGAYVDRRNKKSVLLATNISRAALAILFYFTKGNLFFIYSIAFLTSVSTQFFIPAEASVIPRIVTKDNLLRANSLFTITLYGSVIMGYIIAGPVIKFFGFASSFLLGALFYFVASFFVSLLPSIGREKDVTVGDFLAQGTIERAIIRIREAYHMMRKIKNIVFAIFFLTLSQGLVTILATLLPGFAKTVLKIEGSDISLIILIPASLGMVLGAFFLTRVGRRIPKQGLVNTAILLSGLILIIIPYLFAILHEYNLRIIFVMVNMFILGIANAFIVVISNATLQSVNRELVGRVYGLVVATSAGMTLFPIIIAGASADIFGVKTVLISIGIVMLILGFLKSWRDHAS